MTVARPVSADALPLLDADALRGALSDSPGCVHCAGLVCPGWESVAAPLGAPRLEAVGTLRDPEQAEPSFVEQHDPGTTYWHPRAPIAVTGFPYNRAELWRCPACRRGFLQYTETGGYYVDHRLRAVDRTLVR